MTSNSWQPIESTCGPDFDGADYYAHEALDRLHIVLCMIDDHLLDHKYISDRPELCKLIGEASKRLADAYSIVGAQSLPPEPTAAPHQQ